MQTSQMHWFTLLTISWMLIAVITFIALITSKIVTPYGRHARKGWGAMIDNKWGWFLMELPALIVMPALALGGKNQLDGTSMFLVLLWLIHYTNRTLIFPFRLKTKGKKMPLSIILSALFFNLVNGFLNGYFLGYIQRVDSSQLGWHVWIGSVLFMAGFLINIISDKKLIALRSESTEYQVPRRWLFTYISCPNHFGEIIEWTGFALIAFNLPALSFAVWTFCNLVPRALNHHQWYKQKFENYPPERKAVLPLLI